MHETEVIVVGLGTGGEDVALRLLHAGVDVVGIEPRLVGGECAYWACIPSKIMIRAANLLQEARRVDGMAGHAEVTPDWAPVAARIRAEATGDWDDSFAVARFEAAGGRFVRGWARLTSARTVVVGGETFTATRGIILATGSKPATPPIPGLADTPHWTTHDAIQVEVLPESLIVLGGGAVGCELGQVFSRFGVQVTIVEGADRLLAREEPEASAVLAAVFAAEGIFVSTGRRVERVDRVDGQVTVTLAGGDSIVADELLVAAGRTVDLAELGLGSAGIDDSGRFIAVDGHMRAGDGIWAIGDVTGTGMLTHMALYEGAIVAADILGQSPPATDFASLPRVTFTDPEIGSIGLTEAEARATGLDVAVTVKQVAATFRGWLHGPGNAGIIKLVVDRARGILVGATSAGPAGGEVFGVLSTAMQAQIPIKNLQHMIYAYPTFFGGIGEAIGAYGRGIGKVIDPEYAADVFDF